MDKGKIPKLQELLIAALKKEGAEMGVLREYVAEVDELVVVAHHGFPPEYISQYNSVKPFDRSVCGRAFGIGTTVLISDIEEDLSFKKEIKTIRSLHTDFRAVKSVPLITPRGKKLGVLSSHYKEPKRDWHVKSHDKIVSEITDLLS